MDSINYTEDLKYHFRPKKLGKRSKRSCLFQGILPHFLSICSRLRNTLEATDALGTRKD